jgi:serine protease Do
VAATAPDTQVKIDIQRNGNAKTVGLTMGTMPSEEQPMVAPKEETSWGMAVQELTPQLARQLGLEPVATGVVISDIKDGSPAAEAGLQPGDLISEVNRTAVKNLNDYQRALKKAKRGKIYCCWSNGVVVHCMSSSHRFQKNSRHDP